MKWPDHDEPPACSRLHSWLNDQDTHSSIAGPLDQQSALEAAVRGLVKARRPLIWLESVDVPVARAAVQLAEAHRATLHVAQSPGAAIQASLTSADGWLGTTLAEVGSTATLIVHVGSSHLQAAPMLALRYLNPDAQHVFLDRAPTNLLSDANSPEGTPPGLIQLGWSKGQWLDGLSRALLMMRDDSAALSRPADPLDADASLLAEMLLSHTYSVWLWDEDELSDELDRLIVQRILEAARQVSLTSRSSALSLALDPGRVTAKDCVLWLTNRTTPLRITDTGWAKDHLPYRSLQDWRQAFDWILCVRNLPSDRPLPELPFNAVIDAHCNGSSPRDPSNPQATGEKTRMLVQAVGIDTNGHLLRGDHGLAAFVHGVDVRSTNPYPHAADLLLDLSQRATDAFLHSVQGNNHG